MLDRCVFFFDFDNTLYSHQSKQIPASALNALARLRGMGHRVVLISGRGNESMPMFAAEFDALPDTICLLNGQLIYHQKQLVFDRHLPNLDVQALFTRAKQRGFVYGGYDFQGQVISGINDRVRTVWSDFRAGIPRVRPELPDGGPIYQACLYITQEEQDIFAGILDAYITNWSHTYLCNLISKKAGKSQAVDWCLAYFGADRKNTYAFGDGYNDMDLLAAAGHGIAMENGFGPLKEIAEYIAPIPDRDGVRQALLHYGFL